MGFNVAIDGPAGAGKSTIAKAVARELNLIYVDTGAMYRAVALYMLREGVDLADREKVAGKCPEAAVTIRYEDGVQVVFLNGENVNAFLRTEEVGEGLWPPPRSCPTYLPQSRRPLSAGAIPPCACPGSPCPLCPLCGGAAEKPCGGERLHHGRQGHRHLRAAGRPAEDLPHRQLIHGVHRALHAEAEAHALRQLYFHRILPSTLRFCTARSRRL